MKLKIHINNSKVSKIIYLTSYYAQVTLSIGTKIYVYEDKYICTCGFNHFHRIRVGLGVRCFSQDISNSFLIASGIAVNMCLNEFSPRYMYICVQFA